MSIVRTDIPITSAGCDAMIAELTRTYPSLRSELLTTTAFGRPVRTLVLGNGTRKLLCTAAHHANEWITALILLKFAEDYAENPPDATYYMVPLVDPDGVDLVTGAIEPGSVEYTFAQGLGDFYPAIPFPEGWKANLLGVDLNLQYPAGWLRAREIKFSQGYTRPGPRDYVGRAPLTQLESRALAGYTQAVDPALVLAFHTQGEEIYWQFDGIEIPGARALGEEFARVSGYRLADTPYNSSFAGYKDWFIQEFRRPGYTIEAGSGTNPLPIDQFEAIYRATLPILLTAAG